MCAAPLLPAIALAVASAPLPTPEPAGARDAGLGAVSCPSDTDCVAVGSFLNAGHHRNGLIETWNGTRITIAAGAHLPNVRPLFLTSVSCPPTRACLLVGRKVVDGHISGGPQPV